MNTYDIKYTPDFAYTPINSNFIQNTIVEEKQKNNYDIYVNKFKTAFYGFFLFIILSLPVSYKIVDMIAKIISNNIAFKLSNKQHLIKIYTKGEN